MNYKEALSYIYSFTDYERGSKYSRKGDENIQREVALLELLGNPHDQYSNTLIAGTKGKGSTSAYIERVLREAGIRTGLYTQPDLHTFRERIRVNGDLIPEQEVAQLIPEIRAAVEQVQSRGIFEPFITYEIGTALALLYFARQQVRHAVVEVGLGGRLDATNITWPLVSVITSISYDHMEILGDTLARIATEKAGIIKPDGIVVTSAQAPEALLAITDIAQQRQARMIRIGPEGVDPAQTEVDKGHLPLMSYRYRPGTGATDRRQTLHLHRQRLQSFTVQAPTKIYRDLETPLLGTHQLENATLAIATLDVLHEAGYYWDEAALRNGLRSVHWPARIEVVGHQPTIVVDGAHNTDSIQKLLEALHVHFPSHHLIIVLGVLKNKDQVGMVRALADVDTVILTFVSNPRATPLEELEALFAEHAPHVQIHKVEGSAEALDLALDLADREDLICATGSLYLAGEALRWAAVHGDAAAATDIEGVDHP
jgi:dihydrofolate synthase/folylpolyglutamate synthase